MTQQQYLRSVKRKLHLPYNLKKNVLEDLKETFDTAHDCGEGTENVIERIGTPSEFIKDIMQNIELTEQQRIYINRIKTVRRAIIVFAIIALGISLYFIVQHLRLEMSGIIGYTISPTEIQLIDGRANLLPVIVCILLWLIPIALVIYLLFIKSRINR